MLPHKGSTGFGLPSGPGPPWPLDTPGVLLLVSGLGGSAGGLGGGVASLPSDVAASSLTPRAGRPCPVG
ncbi:hypothetical protein GCM10023192_56750 [Amycolatopsis samaneae]